METRIYAIDLDSIDMENHPVDISNDEFTKLAEQQGLVYSLKGFEEAFNNEEVSDQWFIRILNV